VEIDATVIRGSVGFGCLTTDQRTFLDESIQYEEDGSYLSAHEWQAATLLGDQLTQIDPMDPASVIDTIRGRFRLVGYTEALELFLCFLHRTEGVPLALFNNCLVREAERVPIAPGDVAAIRRHNVADEAVYRAVRQDFGRRVAEIWNEEIDRDYRWYRERLDSFRRTSGGDVNAVLLRY
jgi:hypothetical protein